MSRRSRQPTFSASVRVEGAAWMMRAISETKARSIELTAQGAMTEEPPAAAALMDEPPAAVADDDDIDEVEQKESPARRGCAAPGAAAPAAELSGTPAAAPAVEEALAGCCWAAPAGVPRSERLLAGTGGSSGQLTTSGSSRPRSTAVAAMWGVEQRW